MSTTPSLPPESASPPVPSRKPRWPRVFAILSCLFATWLLYFAPTGFIRNVRLALGCAAKDVVWPPEVIWDGFTSAVFTGLGIVLLVASIRLFQRRASAAMLHCAFALGMLALGAADTIVEPSLSTQGRLHLFYRSCTFWPVALAYPLLCLTWFSRGKITGQLRAWDSERAQAIAPPRWPKVLGILSVSLGGVDLLAALVGLIGSLGRLEELAGAAADVRCWAILGVLARSFVVCAALLLLAGGIQLLRRKRSARMLHIVFGVLGVQACVINLATGIARYPRPHYDAFLNGALSAFVYPMFCLIWFSRSSIRKQLETWTRLPCAPAERPPRWPIAVGIASCLIAGILLPFAAWRGLAGPVKVYSWVHGGEETELLSLADPFTQGLGVAVLILLFVGGVQLLRRKPIAGPLHLIYGAAALVLGVAGAAIEMALFLPPDLPPTFVAGHCSAMITGLVYPAFCLAWFLRKRIREQIRGW